MRKTFEQILQERPDLDLSGSAFDELSDLFQQIRIATIKECANVATTKLTSTSIVADKDIILQLDKNSIEIYEI